MTDDKQNTDETPSAAEHYGDAIEDYAPPADQLHTNPLAVTITTTAPDIIEDIISKLYDDYYEMDVVWLSNDEVEIQTLVLYQHFDPSLHDTKNELLNLTLELRGHCGNFAAVGMIYDLPDPKLEMHSIKNDNV